MKAVATSRCCGTMICTVAASLVANIAVAQIPRLKVDCTGSAFRSEAVPEFKCSWIAHSAEYVLIIGADTLRHPIEGSTTLLGNGPYFFLAAADSNTIMVSRARDVTLHPSSGTLALRATYDLVSIPARYSAPYQAWIRAELPLSTVVDHAVTILQSRGYFVSYDSSSSALPSGPPGSSASSNEYMTLTTSNSVTDNLLCDASLEADCDEPVQKRRIDRRISLVVQLRSRNDSVAVHVTPLVVRRNRREGGPYEPDATISSRALAVCRSVVDSLKAVLARP
jgi:hypothetical protein